MKEYHSMRRIDPYALKNYEFRFIDKQGNVKDTVLTANMIPGTKKSIVSFLDITERKRVEEKIKFVYAGLFQIFNNATDGMCVIDKDFNIFRVNEILSIISDISKDKVIGKKCYEVFCRSLCHTSGCLLTRILGGKERVECEVEKERNDGIRNTVQDFVQ